LTDVDYNLYDFTSSLIYKYSDKFSFSLKAKVYYKPYIKNYIALKAKRKDNDYQAYIGTTYMLSKKYIIQAEYVYTDHQSNYNDFEYKKNSFTINLISLF